ncbi:hypothetical protein pb186bvf_009214 [Paramecium bursaria]
MIIAELISQIRHCLKNLRLIMTFNLNSIWIQFKWKGILQPKLVQIQQKILNSKVISLFFIPIITDIYLIKLIEFRIILCDLNAQHNNKQIFKLMNSQNMQDDDEFIQRCLNPNSPKINDLENFYLGVSQIEEEAFGNNISSNNQVSQDEITQTQVNNNQIEQETINNKKKKGQYGKNASKQLGNYLRKHIIKKKLTHIPQLANFANKKQKNQQANYTLQDLREMLLADNEQQQCREIVLDYLTNLAYIDILLEYKQQKPKEMIELKLNIIYNFMNNQKLYFLLFCSIIINQKRCD